MGTSINGKKLAKGISQRRDDKRYIAKFVSSYDKRRSISKSFTKYNDAERWIIKAKYEDQNGLNGTGEAINVKDWNDIWFKLYTEHIRLITKKSYKVVD